MKKNPDLIGVNGVYVCLFTNTAVKPVTKFMK